MKQVVIEKEQNDNTIKYYTPITVFLGKTNNFTSKDEVQFEKTHLKAYLKGHTEFRFRYTTEPVTDRRIPEYFPVKKTIILKEITETVANRIKDRNNRLKVNATIRVPKEEPKTDKTETVE